MTDMRTLMEAVTPLFEETQWVENDDENLVIPKVDKDAVGHVDDERDMIKSGLYQMGCAAVKLHKLMSSLPEDADLPGDFLFEIVRFFTIFLLKNLF